MPKSNKNGHGGPRKGSGRKPKDIIITATKPEVAAAAEVTVGKIEKSNAGPASAMAADAYAALHDVTTDRHSPAAARVAAAKAIIELAKAEQQVSNEPPGKKAEIEAAAQRVATTPSDGWGEDLVISGRVN